MSKDFHAIRQQKLISKLKKEGVEVLLVTNFTNVTYLTGFSGDDSYLLIGQDLTILISDTRYSIQISEECSGLDVYTRINREPMPEVVAKLLTKSKLKKVGIESNSMSVELLEQMQEKSKTAEFVPASGLIEDLRQIKDKQELKEIRESISQAERGFALLKASLTGDMTELEVAHELEHAMRRFGAQGKAFDPIVAVGPRAALPHARPGHQLISESDFVLIDWGAMNLNGYKSDLTRVLVTGKILTKLEKIYRVVLKAQLNGIQAIRPGASCHDVDAAARSVIEKAGFGKQFSHSLGHGFGLDIHERPNMNPGSELVLKAGMVVTVEPGIYLPGWGGVRIEDDILVTRHGHEVLTSVPKEFEQMILN